MLTAKSPERALHKSFFDAGLLADESALAAPSHVADANRILFGSDWPFTSRLYGPEPDPGPTLTEVFGAADQRRLDRLNAHGHFPWLAKFVPKPPRWSSAPRPPSKTSSSGIRLGTRRPFGLAGREPARPPCDPRPWRRNVNVSLELIDDLEVQIAQLTVQLKRLGADHRYIPLLVSAPGFGSINAFTVASEIGDIERFASPAKLCGYTGLCPRVMQSGNTDRRGPISKHGPRYLRWGCSRRR